MGMKNISRYIIRISLILMIALSVHLSKLIWINVSKSDSKESNTTNTLVQSRQASDVLLPDKLYLHDDSNVLVSVKESLINQVMSQFYDIKVQKVSQVSINNKDEYLKQQAIDNGVELMYTSAIPGDYFANAFGVKGKLDEEILFDRILLDFDSNEVYLLRDEDFAIFEITSNLVSELEIVEKLVSQDDITYIAVEKDDTYLVTDYFSVGELTMKQYSYILSTQSYTNFVQLLFNDRTDLYSNDNSANVSLSNGVGESLIIDGDTNHVTYLGRITDSETEETDFSLLMSYGLRLGTSLGNIRFFGQNADDDLIFSNYVEGYPVFGDDNRGMVKISLDQETAAVRLETSQDTIQIPVPSDEVSTLKSMRELLEDCVDKGIDTDKILQIHIGYRWEINSEASQVVDLIPDWYVNYDGKWYQEDELKDIVKAEEAG